MAAGFLIFLIGSNIECMYCTWIHLLPLVVIDHTYMCTDISLWTYSSLPPPPPPPSFSTPSPYTSPQQNRLITTLNNTNTKQKNQLNIKYLFL